MAASVPEAAINERASHPKLRGSLGGLPPWTRSLGPWPSLALAALTLSVVVTTTIGYEGRPEETAGLIAAACAAGLFAALALFLVLTGKWRLVQVGAAGLGIVGLTLLANAGKMGSALEAQRAAQTLVVNARSTQEEAPPVESAPNRALQTYNALFSTMSATAEAISKMQGEIEPPLVKQSLGPKYDITTIATQLAALRELRAAFQTALFNNRAAEQKLDQIFAAERSSLEAAAQALGSAEGVARNLSKALAALREPEVDLLKRMGRARGDRYGAFSAAIDTLIANQSAVKVSGGQLVFQSREALTSWNAAKRNLSVAEDNLKRLEAEWVEMEKYRSGAMEKVLARK